MNTCGTLLTDLGYFVTCEDYSEDYIEKVWETEDDSDYIGIYITVDGASIVDVSVHGIRKVNMLPIDIRSAVAYELFILREISKDKEFLRKISVT